MTKQHSSNETENTAREVQSNRTRQAGIELVELELKRVTGGIKFDHKVSARHADLFPNGNCGAHPGTTYPSRATLNDHSANEYDIAIGALYRAKPLGDAAQSLMTDPNRSRSDHHFQ